MITTAGIGVASCAGGLPGSSLAGAIFFVCEGFPEKPDSAQDVQTELSSVSQRDEAKCVGDARLDIVVSRPCMTTYFWMSQPVVDSLCFFPCGIGRIETETFLMLTAAA